MASSHDENSQTPDDFERRRQIWRTLIDEGVLQNKPPQELTVDDLDQIDLRLSLEAHAAEDGMTVDEMFKEWGDDSKYTIGPFSAKEMSEYLRRAIAEEEDRPSDDASLSDHAGDAN